MRQVLLAGAVISWDAAAVWSYPGWKDGGVVALFLSSVAIGCAMNFTTYHCTYLNSAVTTSFVGVVKSVVTITVGMLAFDDVEPSALFVAGVVVNTVGSLTYCAVKFFELKKKSAYEHLEGGGGDGDAAAANLREAPRPGEAGGDHEAGGLPSRVTTEKDEDETRGQRLRQDAAAGDYLGVWRSVRQLRLAKEDGLVRNMEQQSP